MKAENIVNQSKVKKERLKTCASESQLALAIGWKNDDSLKTVSIHKNATQKYMSFIWITFDTQVSSLLYKMVDAGLPTMLL